LWDAASGRETATLRGHTHDVWAVRWSPDGRRLASSGDGGVVKLWDTATGREVLTLRGHTGSVPALDWSRDGLRLASGSQDGTVRIWDATAGFQAEHSPQLLPELDRRVRQSGGNATAALLLRAAVHARQGRWQQAADDWQQGRRGGVPWFEAGWWVAKGPLDLDVVPGAEPDPFQPFPAVSSLPDKDQKKPRGWLPATPTADGYLDLDKLFPATSSAERSSGASACVLVRVYSPQQQPATAHVDASGTLRLWLNGRPLAAVNEAPLSLRVGWNTLLVRVGLKGGAARLPRNHLRLWLSG
jgi:WD40 repeat protein